MSPGTRMVQFTCCVFCALISSLTSLCLPPGTSSSLQRELGSVCLVLGAWYHLKVEASFSLPDGKLAGFWNAVLFG